MPYGVFSALKCKKKSNSSSDESLYLNNREVERSVLMTIQWGHNLDKLDFQELVSKRNVWIMVLAFLIRVTCVVSAVYMVVPPTLEYNGNNPLMQIGTITTAALLNAYAAFASNDSKISGCYFWISLLLGVLTSLPFFFMELAYLGDRNLGSVLLSFFIMLGSFPLQTLGFIEFFNSYLDTLLSPCSRAHRQKAVALRELRKRINRIESSNKLPPPISLPLSKNLLPAIVRESIELGPHFKESSNFKCGDILGSLVAGVLAQGVNISFIKSTYMFFDEEHFDITSNLLLTTIIAFPMVVLSYDFGRIASNAILGIFWASLRNLGARFRRQEVREYIFPAQLHLPLWTVVTSLMLLLTLNSYAELVRFNETVFPDLAQKILDPINDFTAASAMLFNSYATIMAMNYLLILAVEKAHVTLNKPEKLIFSRMTQYLVDEISKVPPSVFLTRNIEIINESAIESITPDAI